jgi:NAD(P)-dependent dehydrogenase (short-subunit alcohol dehydrogenase family)
MNSDHYLDIREKYVMKGIALYHPLTIDKGRNYEYIKCDVSSEAYVMKTINYIDNKHKRIDVLVNNAGILIIKPIEKT